MFKINYTYQKGGPEYNCQYPDPRICDHNIFVIKGKNDRGKSTIMQMIALGLLGSSGIESEDIDNEIKKKILRLLKSIDKCEFKFIITEKDDKTKLEAQLKNGEITTKLNNEKVGLDRIKDEFKIIFDIPTEPIKKLNSALKSIINNLYEYEIYVKNYKNSVEKALSRIEEYTKKKHRLEEETSELKSLKKSFEEYTQYLNGIKEKFKDIEKANLIKKYRKYNAKLEILLEDKKKINKKIKKLRSKGLGGGTPKYNQIIEDFRIVMTRLRFLVNTSLSKLAISLSEEEKKELNRINEEINSVFSSNDLNDENLNKWWNFYSKIEESFRSDPTFEKKLPEEDQILLIERLIDILKDFIGIKGTIPGTNGKTVREFIDELQSTKEKLYPRIRKKSDLKEKRELCKEILIKLSELSEIYKKVPKISSSDVQELNMWRKQMEEIKKEIKRINKEMNKMELEYQSIPPPEKSRLSQIKVSGEEYQKTKDEISKIEEKIENLRIKIESKQKLIEKLKNIKKPYPSWDEGRLLMFNRICSILLRKINSWEESIRSLDLKKISFEGELNTDSKELYEALAYYFADILKVVYFEQRGWSVKKVDFINRCFVVEDRERPIDFVDIGTGHNELNSLLAKLKQDYGGKKKIVLFDEIGIMDKENVNKLLNEIKKQVKNGKILFALLTQVDNNVENVVFEPVVCD